MPIFHSTIEKARIHRHYLARTTTVCLLELY
jgi:hypothetical protein